MIIDLAGYTGEDVRCDLCIIGAGAAGITIAREFLNGIHRVCLLESGGLEYEAQIQDLYDGENTGLPYYDLISSRLRYFGGTTNHWNGRCAPLDSIDFKKRSWVPYSGWPMSKQDLDPYYLRAQKICGLGEFVYDNRAWKQLNIDSPPPVFDENKVDLKFFQFSDPVVRFGQVFRDELAGAKNIDIYLHATVTNIQTNREGNQVEHLKIASLDGSRTEVSAKLYVLACGGIENPRLLLLSNKVRPAGVGNSNDLVGRFFMEHPKGESGDVISDDKYLLLDWFQKHYPNTTVPHWPSLCASESQQEILGLLNSSASIYYTPRLGTSGAELVDLYESIKDDEDVEGWGRKIWAVVTDLDELVKAGYRRYVEGKKPIVDPGRVYLWCRCEQAPNPDSRIQLSRDKDALGQHRIELNWQLSLIDRQTLLGLTRTIGEEFGRLGLGRVKLEDWTMDDSAEWKDLHGGRHHMGTTRMSDDPKSGVVNGDCRVHECNNLYVAGSSVFTTGGWANPTLTIVALALRMSEHLKGRLDKAAKLEVKTMAHLLASNGKNTPFTATNKIV